MCKRVSVCVCVCVSVCEGVRESKCELDRVSVYVCEKGEWEKESMHVCVLYLKGRKLTK